MDLVAEVREILSSFERRMETEIEGAPPEIRDELRRTFAMAPSTVTEGALRDLLVGLPTPLPPSFVAFLRAFDHEQLEHREGSLPAVGGEHALLQVHALLRQPSLWHVGLMQCSIGPSGDPVCFDISDQLEPGGEYGIVTVNHDLAPTAAWSDRSSLAPFIRTMEPSFLDYMRARLS